MCKSPFSRIFDREKLLSKNSTAEIPMVNNCKTKSMVQVSNPMAKKSNSKKSDEKNSDGEKSKDRTIT